MRAALAVASIMAFSGVAQARRVVASPGKLNPAGVAFVDPQAASIDDQGDITFVDATLGLYAERDGALLEIAKTGATLTSGGTFGPFPTSGVIPPAYQGAFTYLARVGGKDAVARGLKRLFGEGDAVDASTVGPIDGYLATSGTGLSLVRSGQQQLIAIAADDAVSLFAAAGQDLPGRSGYQITSLLGYPQALTDGTVLYLAGGYSLGAARWNTLQALQHRQTSAESSVEPPGLVTGTDAWFAESMVASADGRLAMMGTLNFASGNPASRSVWSGPLGALTQALALPLTLGSTMVTQVAPKALGQGTHFAALATTSTVGDVLLWYDGSGAEIVATPGDPLPDRPGFSILQIGFIAVGGDPEIVVAQAYCTQSAMPSATCTAILRYDTATQALTTVAASGDMTDAGALGTAVILQPRIVPSFGAGHGSAINAAGVLVWDAICQVTSGSPSIVFSEGGADAPQTAADVALVTITPGSVSVGGLLDYFVPLTVTISNSLDDAATNVVYEVEAALPAALTSGHDLLGPSACNVLSDRRVQCTVSLAPGETITPTFTFGYKADHVDAVAQFTATITSTDADSSNNSVTRDLTLSGVAGPGAKKRKGCSVADSSSTSNLVLCLAALIALRRRARITAASR